MTIDPSISGAGPIGAIAAAAFPAPITIGRPTGGGGSHRGMHSAGIALATATSNRCRSTSAGGIGGWEIASPKGLSTAPAIRDHACGRRIAAVEYVDDAARGNHVGPVQPFARRCSGMRRRDHVW